MDDNTTITVDGIVEVSHLVATGIKKFGKDKFLKDIRSLILKQETLYDNYDNIIEYVLDCVVDEYKDKGVTKEGLFEYVGHTGKGGKRGEVTLARKTCFVIFDKHLEIPHKNIGWFFGGRSRAVVYKTLKEYEAMNESPKIYKDFLDRYSCVSEKVETYLLKIKAESDGQEIN